MEVQFAIQTACEILFVGVLLIGFCHEKQLIEWEDRTWAKIKAKFCDKEKKNGAPVFVIHKDGGETRIK